MQRLGRAWQWVEEYRCKRKCMYLRFFHENHELRASKRPVLRQHYQSPGRNPNHDILIAH